LLCQKNGRSIDDIKESLQPPEAKKGLLILDALREGIREFRQKQIRYLLESMPPTPTQQSVVGHGVAINRQVDGISFGMQRQTGPISSTHLKLDAVYDGAFGTFISVSAREEKYLGGDLYSYRVFNSLNEDEMNTLPLRHIVSNLRFAKTQAPPE